MNRPLVLIFFLLTVRSYGQVDTTSIYSQALKFYNTYLDKVNSQSIEIFIEENFGITDKLPAHVGMRSVTILNGENQKGVYLKHNRKIIQLKIFPARVSNDIIEIQLTPYSGQYKGKSKGYFLSLSDWVIIQFKFDSADRKFRYWNTKTGGI